MGLGDSQGVEQFRAVLVLFGSLIVHRGCSGSHAALRGLAQHLRQKRHECLSREDKLQLEEWEISQYVQHFSEKFPLTYKWDLGRFCGSFVRRSAQAQHLDEIESNPVFVRLKSQLADIQSWAKITEQLLKVFTYLKALVGESWPLFPGARLWKLPFMALIPAG